jgi:hypothetical protein
LLTPPGVAGYSKPKPWIRIRFGLTALDGVLVVLVVAVDVRYRTGELEHRTSLYGGVPLEDGTVWQPTRTLTGTRHHIVFPPVQRQILKTLGTRKSQIVEGHPLDGALDRHQQVLEQLGQLGAVVVVVGGQLQVGDGTQVRTHYVVQIGERILEFGYGVAADQGMLTPDQGQLEAGGAATPNAQVAVAVPHRGRVERAQVDRYTGRTQAQGPS